MSQKSETTVEDKLRALYDLQLIDSRIDELRNLRGELPLEVEDLENEISGLNARLDKLMVDLEETNNEVKTQKGRIEQAQQLHDKYKKNLKNVRNNREYNSIVKEQSYQELEIQLAEKKIAECKVSLELRQESISQLKEKIEAHELHLKTKKNDLDAVLKETKKEEDVLLKKSIEFEKQIEQRLVNAYKRIRKNVRNGLAIVAVERGASAGSFFAIPPQTQLEIASRSRIIIDEHSGRILVDADLANEERQKIDALFE